MGGELGRQKRNGLICEITGPGGSRMLAHSRENAQDVLIVKLYMCGCVFSCCVCVVHIRVEREINMSVQRPEAKIKCLT